MAPQIAHKHHRGHGKLTLGRCLGLMLSRYTIRLPFVGTRSTECPHALSWLYIEKPGKAREQLRGMDQQLAPHELDRQGTRTTSGPLSHLRP